MSKTFTWSEAQTLVPVLDALMQRAKAAVNETGRLDAEMQALTQRIYLSGGLHVDVAVAARTRAERDKAAQEAKAILEEIGEIGAEIKDFEEGVLGLPSMVEGRVVWLCWSAGDTEITFWREAEDGDDVRREVDGRFGRGGERPN